MSGKRKQLIEKMKNEKTNRRQRRAKARELANSKYRNPTRQPTPLSIPRFVLTAAVEQDAPDYRQWIGMTLAGRNNSPGAVFAFSSASNARRFCEVIRLGPEWRVDCLGYDALESWLEESLRRGDSILIRDATSFGPAVAFAAPILNVLEALLHRDHDAGELKAGFNPELIFETLPAPGPTPAEQVSE